MGNSQVKKVMTPFQSPDFNDKALENIEQAMFEENDQILTAEFAKLFPDSMPLLEQLKKGEIFEFRDFIDMNASGLEPYDKRALQEKKYWWQSCFTTPQKKLAMLQQGEYKTVIIPSNNDASAFSRSLQQRALVLLVKFYSRNQVGVQSLEDFFTFAKKHQAKMESQTIYKGIIDGESSFDSIDENFINQMLVNSEMCEAKQMFSTSLDSFFSDLQHRRLNQSLIRKTELVDTTEQKQNFVLLLFRNALMRACPQDLLVAADLIIKHKVDVLKEMQFFCKQSEKYRLGSLSPVAPQQIDIVQLQSKCSFSGDDDITSNGDQLIALGSNWFYTQRNILNKASRSSDIAWSWQEKNQETPFQNNTMLVMNKKLYIRHSLAPDQPFVEVDTETLRVKEQQTTWKGDMPLRWTSLETNYGINEQEGNRWMRKTPLFYDGEFLYALAEYRQQGATSKLVKIVLETYSIKDNREIILEAEVPLTQTLEAGYKQYNFLYDETAMDTVVSNSSTSFACNGAICVIYSNQGLSYFDQNSGLLIPTQSLGFNHISTYIPEENQFYRLDIACYGTMVKFRVKDFQPKDLQSKYISLPQPPVLLDQAKGGFIKQQKERDVSELKAEELPQYDIFQRLIKKELTPLKCVAPKTSNRGTLFTDHRMAKTIIISVMGVEAHNVIQKIKDLGSKKILGEEMLNYFKIPFAVYLSEEFLFAVRMALHESIKNVRFNNLQLMDLSETHNLLKVYYANMLCMKKCRIDPRVMLSSDEISKIRDLLIKDFTRIIDLKVGGNPLDPLITPEQIMVLHIKEIASDLVNFLDKELDFDPIQSKLKNLEQNLQSIVLGGQNNQLYAQKALRLMSSESSLQEIFESNQEIVETSRHVLQLSLVIINQMFAAQVDKGVRTRIFKDSLTAGIYKELVIFAKSYCQELTFAFGKQLLTIDENQGVEGKTDLSKEEMVKLASLKQAQAKRLQLETILYDTFIMISVQFKEQVQAVTEILKEGRLYKWESSNKLEGFFDMLKGMYQSELSLVRIVLSFCLSVCSFVPNVIWLDEITEALKNCATALNQLIVTCNSLPETAENKVREKNTALPYIKYLHRYVNFAIGNVACQLIQRNVGEESSQDLKQLAKLNILQGGIEPRFIPALSSETKLQIEGSFKITLDETLRTLASKKPEQIIYDSYDILLATVIDKSPEMTQTEVAIAILQESLKNKRPMVPHAQIGGEDGMRLCRAAFAVIVKFSNQLENFSKFTIEIERAGSAVKSDPKMLSKYLEERVPMLLQVFSSKWEQASQMRKWTQFIKLQISESVKKKVQDDFAKEISDSNPSAEPFNGSFSEQQKEQIENRSNQQFDVELQQKYGEVVTKAKFLIKLQLPEAFIEAQKAIDLEELKKKSSKEEETQNAKKDNFNNLSKKLVNNLTGKLGLGQKVTLISESKLGQPDKEVDWRDSLKQWRKVQQSTGAVSSLADKNQSIFQSCFISVLGCLQASFTAAQLQKKVEESLVNGLRRSAGLHLMSFAMQQTHCVDSFMDMVNWFQGSLRRNKSHAVYYLQDLDGCGFQAEIGIRTQFFAILRRILYQIRQENGCDNKTKDRLTHLVNAVCYWNFRLSDHDELLETDIFNTLVKPNNDLFHPITMAWGTEQGLQTHNDVQEFDFALNERLRGAFAFLTKTILGSVVVEENSKIETGAGSGQANMIGIKSAYNQEATENIICQIIDCLFTNFQRYLVCISAVRNSQYYCTNCYVYKEVQLVGQDGIPSDPLLDHYLVMAEGRDKYSKTFQLGKLKLETYMKDIKIDMVIQKVTAADFNEQSPIYSTVKNLLAGKSISATIELIVQRQHDAIDALSKMSWQSFGLQEPVLTDEQIKTITQVETQEWQAEMMPKEDEYTAEGSFTRKLTADECKMTCRAIIDIPVENKEILVNLYSVYSMIALMDIFDYYLSLSEGATSPIFFVSEKIGQPQNLKILIRLSVEGDPWIQFLAHRILQNVLRCNLPIKVLNEAVALAGSAKLTTPTIGQQNEVKRLLSLESPLTFKGGAFLQLYFNQLFEVRKTQYYRQHITSNGMTSVVDEAVRTMRIAALDPTENGEMKEIYDTTIRDAILNRIESMNELEVDSILTLIPEAQFERIAFGTPCMDSSGKRFTVLGFTDDSESRQYLWWILADQTEKVVGLSYNSVSPEQQDIAILHSYEVRTLIDLDKEQTVKAKETSLLKEASIVKKLISLTIADEAPRDKKAAELLKTFVLRGLFAMMQELGAEYINFLQGLRMQDNFFTYLLNEVKNEATFKQLLLSSATHLELRASFIRERNALDNTKYLGREDSVTIDNDNGTLILQHTVKSGLNTTVKNTSFQIKMMFDNNETFEGSYLVTLPPHIAMIDEIPAYHMVFVFDSADLNEITVDTLLMISNFTRTLITDDGVNFDKFFNDLKRAKEDRIVRLDYLEQITFVVVSKESLKTIKAALTHAVVEQEENNPPVRQNQENWDAPPVEQPNFTAAIDSSSRISDFLKQFLEVRTVDEGDISQSPAYISRYKENFNKAVVQTAEMWSQPQELEEMSFIFKQLKQSYSRKLLLMMISLYGENLSRQQATPGDQYGPYRKLCNMVHNDYQTMVAVKRNLGQTHPLNESEEQIVLLMQQLKQNEAFRDYFMRDFNYRVSAWIELCSKDDFSSHDGIKIDNFRQMESESRVPVLHPANLLYFQQLINELGYYGENDTKKAEWQLGIFNANLVYSILFKDPDSSDDAVFRLQLLRSAKTALININDNLESFLLNKPVTVQLLSHQILKTLVESLTDVSLTNSVSSYPLKKIMIEIATQLFQMITRSGSKLTLPFQMEPRLKEIIGSMIAIEKGQSFETFMADAKLQALVESDFGSQSVRHLTEIFQSDKKIFELENWEHEFTATDCDMKFLLQSCPPGETLTVQRIGIDQNLTYLSSSSTKSAQSSTFEVKKGQILKVAFPGDLPLVKFTGKNKSKTYINYESSYKELTSTTWIDIPNSSYCNPLKVCGAHRACLVQSADGSVWGYGHKVQGITDEALIDFRKIELPAECKGIKKIAHGKFTRFILSEDNQLFFNGLNRLYQFGTDQYRDGYMTQFYSKGTYFNIDQDDQVVDIAGGKAFIACVTKNGKVYSSGYVWSDLVSYEIKAGNYDNQNIFAPEGHKALNLWCSPKHYILFVTFEKTDGTKVTKKISGQNPPISGTLEAEYNKWMDLEFPPTAAANTYFTDISTEKDLAIGIDQDQNLWVFGPFTNEIVEKQRVSEMFEGFDPNNPDKPTPRRFKWFDSLNLKVVKARCGSSHIIVLTKDKDGNLGMYGIAANITDQNANLFGSDFTKVYCDNVVKLNLNAANVKDFCCLSDSTFLIMGKEKKAKIPSIIPDKPNDTGLTHFYQKNGRWEFVSQSEYQAKKDSLPNICFATRHAIQNFHQKIFPDLDTLSQNLKPHRDYPLRDSQTGEVLAPGQPIWFSHANISGQAQQIALGQIPLASKQYQKYDLNPLIFYRIKNVTFYVDTLPAFDLEQYFTRKDGQLRFSFSRSEITSADIDAVKLEDPVSSKLLHDVISEFKEEENREMLNAIDKELAKISFTVDKISELNPDVIKLEKSMFRSESPLQNMSNQLINVRKSLMIKFMKAWYSLLEFVDIKDSKVKGSLSAHHFKYSSIIVPSITKALVEKDFSSIEETYDTPEVQVSRRKAMMFADSGKTDHNGSQTVFGQIITALDVQQPNLINFRKKGREVKCFRIYFIGEGGIDAGGLFRDCLTNISQELESKVLPLFIKTPNNKNEYGNNRECFILNSQSTSARHLKMFKYFGALLGFSILSQQPLALNLAPIFWKQLSGHISMSLSDLDTIDSYSYQMLNNLRTYGTQLPEDVFDATVDQNFTTILSDGTEVQLCTDGASKKVTLGNLEEFIKLVLKARASEASEQMKAVREGVEAVLQGHSQVLGYLSWESLEARACGEKVFDTEKLRSITTFPNCANDHPIVGRFWRTFESFSEIQKAQYLKFAWGRTRLPLDCSELNYKHQVRLIDSLNINGFPQSHTCFFQLDIPAYQTDEVCRQRLISAAELCGQIDNDRSDVVEETE